jgi:NifB/MoaA-like Fe-S oxidoreductase
MKKGMRETLYVKDDDYRLSFISGNYITLTNLSDGETERIKRLKLSPLYVSVHAFDAGVRRMMLGNRFAGRLFAILKEFGEAGVRCHTQIVLVEGVNDGRILEETVEELYKMPSVLSVAIVPVGLTGHRGGLHKIEPLSVGCIDRTVDFAESFAKKVKNDGERGSAFVWCADEMYIRAGRKLPPFEYYEDFCQIENGVGLAARFVYDARDYFAEYEGKDDEKEGFSFAEGNSEKDIKGEFIDGGALYNDGGKEVLSFGEENGERERKNSEKSFKIEMVTGAAFYKIMVETAAFFEERIRNLKIRVTKIKNNFFGESVTVAGLLTGFDIAEQFKPMDDTDLVLIPKAMLKEFDDVFLDGTTVGELAEKLGKRVAASPSDGYELAEFLDRIAVEGL